MGGLEISPTPVAKGDEYSQTPVCEVERACRKDGSKSFGSIPRKTPGIRTRIVVINNKHKNKNFQMTQWNELHVVRVNRYYVCH